MTSVLVVSGFLAFASRAEAQGGRAGHSFSPWENLPWSALEARARCDGGPLGVSGGPVNWTVQFHNRAKVPVSFDYQLSNSRAEGRGQVPVKGRTTLTAGGIFEKPVSLRT